MNDRSRPKAAPEKLRGDEGPGTSVPAGADNARRPTAADITALLRERPRDGDSAEVRDRWIARKHRMLAAIEEATR